MLKPKFCLSTRHTIPTIIVIAQSGISTWIQSILCECSTFDLARAMIENLNNAASRVTVEDWAKQFAKTVGIAAMKGIEEGLKNESD